MKKQISFITRSDDLGSSRSANEAIMRVVKNGFIKNVSVIAPSHFANEAAKMFEDVHSICFGMHATLNSEWDYGKWGPVSNLDQSSGLLDENGFFAADPKIFQSSKPPIELILKEFDAQLDLLAKLGFSIEYFDSHMFPEMYIDGLDDALQQWIQSKGLIDHMYFYELPPGFENMAKHPLKVLHAMPEGQYFFLSHPSLDSPEMRKMGNESVSGADVAKARGGETKMLSAKWLPALMRHFGVSPIRYDEATAGRRISVDEVRQAMNL